jgi:hypothetical protein
LACYQYLHAGGLDVVDMHQNIGAPSSGAIKPRGLFFRRTAAPEARMADIIQQRKARQQCTAQLLRDNQQLRSELSSIYHTCENIGVRTSRLVLLARAAGSRY